MKKLFGFLLAFTTIIQPLLAQQGIGYITGRVMRPDGAPAGNIRVAAIPVGSTEALAASTTQTDAAGNYRMLIQPGRYYVTAGSASAPQFYPGVNTRERGEIIEVIAGATKDFINIGGFSGSSTYTWTGRVVPAPSPGTVVRVSQGGRNTVQGTVNPDGSFVLSGMIAGGNNVEIARPTGGYVQVGAMRVDDDIKATVILSGRLVVDDGSVFPSPNGSIPSYAALAAEASSLTPGRPVPARVRSAIRPDGAFDLLLPEGEYTFGLRNIPISFDVQSILAGTTDLITSKLVVSSSATLGEVRVVVHKTQPQGVAVGGKVTGFPAGVSANGFINLIGSGIGSHADRARINPDGTYEFPRVAPGTYAAIISNVSVQGGSLTFAPLFWFLDVGQENMRRLDFPAYHIPGFLDGALGNLEPLQRLTGIISVTGSQTVPAGVEVRLSGGTPSLAAVNAKGTFNVPVSTGDHRIALLGLPAGYTVRAMTWGNIDVLANPVHIDAATSTDQPLRITLDFDAGRAAQGLGLANGSVSGRILKADGSPAAGVRVEVAKNLVSAAVAGATTDSSGNYRIDDILPDDYILVVDRSFANGISPARIVTPQGGAMSATDPPVQVPIHYGASVNVGTAIAGGPFSQGSRSFILYGVQR